jgi:hypothetical protein
MTRETIVQRFAPLILAKAEKEWPAADCITGVDYAGSIAQSAENPDKLMAAPWNRLIDAGKVYYSVCETTTHWFVLYAIYHPLDWYRRGQADNLYDLIRDKLDEHVHDMEGALMVVSKDYPQKVEGLFTIFHHDFYLYRHRRGKHLGKFREDCDGEMRFDKNMTKRPKLYVQARGHGIKGDKKGWGGGHMIIYYRPEHEASKPDDGDVPEVTRHLTYTLEDMHASGGLWSHRNDPRVFLQRDDGRWSFSCRKSKTARRLVPGAANPPWSWYDHNDPSYAGEIATDPASFILRYVNGWGAVSRQYVYNPYLGIDLDA